MASQLEQEERAQYLRAVFDGIPLPSFIVDGDARIHDLNNAAERFLGGEPGAALLCRCGDAFQCIHAQEKGCGRGEACPECALRGAVASALRGENTVRQPHQARLGMRKATVHLDLLVSATLLPYTQPPQTLLVLEEVKKRKLPQVRPESRQEEPSGLGT